MDDYDTNYNKIANNIYSERLIKLDYLIKHEIFSKFPRLTAEEMERRKKLSRSKNKDDLFMFYKEIKKKYSNFLELNSIDNHFIIHDLYYNVSDYDNYKINLQNRQFSFGYFIMTEIGNSVYEDFGEKLSERLRVLGSKVMNNEDEFWLNALIDTKYVDKSLPNINYIIKYDPNLHSNSLIITLECIYEGVEKEIFSLLYSKPDVRKIILKFGMKTYQSMTKKIYKYNDESEWNFDGNRLINIFLNTLIKNDFPNLYAVTIVTVDQCHITLDLDNSNLMNTFLAKYSNKLELFISVRFRYDISSQKTMLDIIKKMKFLKMITFVGAKFTEENLAGVVDWFEMYLDIAYFRFSKFNTISRLD